MSTIVSMCPYCRAGGVRAPQSAVGASATCPRCKSNFTVMPGDDPGPAAAPPEATAETRPAPALTEPSPVLSAALGAAPRAPVEPPAAASAEGVPVLAACAFALVGPAALATQLPYGRALALAACAAGLALACAGAGGGTRARAWGAGAALAHVWVAAVVLFLPAWLGLGPWHTGALPDAPIGPFAVDDATGTARAVSGPLDAPREAYASGDLRVSATVAPGHLDAAGRPAPRGTGVLLVSVFVQNTGAAARPLSEWATGRGARGATATDETGKPLKPVPVPDAPRTAALAPGRTCEVKLAFLAPKSGAVLVTLSGAAVGAPGDVPFRFAARAPRDR